MAKWYCIAVVLRSHVGLHAAVYHVEKCHFSLENFALSFIEFDIAYYNYMFVFLSPNYGTYIKKTKINK